MSRAVFAIAFLLTAATALAQNGPTIKLGGTLFTDFTYQSAPETRDADGNEVSPSSFNVTRAYINVTGTLIPRLSYRITPDIVRESGSGSSLSGSQTFRLKFAFVQLALDGWTTKGSFVRAGLQPTPYLEGIEAVYRYRFQGATFTDREAYVRSADNGVAGRWAFPRDRGDVQIGFYNGEGFTHAEANDQKSFQVRGTYRIRGLRLTAFVIDDYYVEDAARSRIIGAATYEHPRVHAGIESMTASDQASRLARQVDASGISLWATPRFARGFEALVRFDRLEPDDANDSRKTRNVVGVAWWPTMPKGTSAAIMLDREGVQYSGFEPARANEVRYGVHLLLSF